jgi:hypothetical protein
MREKHCRRDLMWLREAFTKRHMLHVGAEALGIASHEVRLYVVRRNRVDSDSVPTDLMSECPGDGLQRGLAAA